MRTMDMGARRAAGEPETDPVMVVRIGRLHRWSRSIFPCVGKGFAGGVRTQVHAGERAVEIGRPARGHNSAFLELHYRSPCRVDLFSPGTRCTGGAHWVHCMTNEEPTDGG